MVGPEGLAEGNEYNGLALWLANHFHVLFRTLLLTIPADIDSKTHQNIMRTRQAAWRPIYHLQAAIEL